LYADVNSADVRSLTHDGQHSLQYITRVVTLNQALISVCYAGQGSARYVRYFFADKVRIQYEYVVFPYVNRTLASLYDENKLCASY